MSRNASPRRFQNNLDKWHYSACSEIKIHFYVKNLYLGNQSEDQFLHFIRERVQKAGPCELVQITEKNQLDRTIDIAIGMRYDKDAKLIYIGKKHINLMFNRDKKIVPVISNIFETMLKERGEVDKQVLEERLRQQRYGDQKQAESSSSPSERIPKITPLVIQPLREVQPIQLTMPQVLQPFQIFGIPSEFTLQECLNDIRSRYNLQQVPEGVFKTEKVQDTFFEYLEVQLDSSIKNIKIKNIPCLVCQRRKKSDSFADILKQYQLNIKTTQQINTNKLLRAFSQYGDIIGLYEVTNNNQDEQQSNSHYIVYASEQSLKKLNPPGQLEIEDKMICTFQIPDQNFVSFQRIPYKQTLYAQIRPDSSSSTSSSSSSSSSRSRSDSQPKRRKEQHQNRSRKGNIRKNFHD